MVLKQPPETHLLDKGEGQICSSTTQPQVAHGEDKLALHAHLLERRVHATRGGLHVRELLRQQKGLPGLPGGWERDETWPVLTSAETLPKLDFLATKTLTFLY